jgi:hypothetical protein
MSAAEILSLDKGANRRPRMSLLRRAMSTTASAAAPALRAFDLALIQLGGVGHDKAHNLRHARDMLLRAARGPDAGRKPELLVLPECFNSPYGAQHFPGACMPCAAARAR